MNANLFLKDTFVRLHTIHRVAVGIGTRDFVVRNPTRYQLGYLDATWNCACNNFLFTLQGENYLEISSRLLNLKPQYDDCRPVKIKA